MAKTTVSIDIVGDSSTAVKAFQKAQRQLRQLELAAAQTSTGMRAKLGAVGQVAGKMGSALRRAALPLALFGGASLRAFEESEQANVRLMNSLKNNPKLLGASAERFKALASAIQLKTAADDESVVSGIAVLANFDLTAKQIETVTPLMVDYARKTGQDVPSAAGVLGKAMLGNARALKAIGINFKATGDKGKDFATITDLVRAKVGGFAEEEGKTAGGQLAILKNRFGEVAEKVGGALVPALSALARNLDVIGPIILTLTAAIVAYKTTMAIATVVTAAFGTTAAAAWTAAALPVALLVAAVVAAGLAIYKFRSGVLMAIRFIVDKWLGLVGFFVNGAAKAFGWIPGLGPKLKTAAAAFNEFRDDVNASLGGIKKTLSIDVLMNYKQGETTPGRASGGPVTAGRPYRVGERGPELFVPNTSGRIIPNNRMGRSGGGNVTININGARDPKAIAREVGRILGRDAAAIGRTA